MNRMQTIGSAVSRLALAAVAWAIAQGSALAAGGGSQLPTSTGESNSYVLGYMIVLVCVGLGLAAALHSSRRSDRPRFQALADEAAQRKASTTPKA